MPGDKMNSTQLFHRRRHRPLDDRLELLGEGLDRDNVLSDRQPHAHKGGDVIWQRAV